ncbi:hypothetical protein E2562_028770 [Oryza meyeriana var. granulata]|uniref:Uncharacterized protein n=1 Tax=Oryza meyeriana var. granulata TaxID=110450 RepID=A0A6G1FDA0_9ORYZ|nr:hypothetical protein E2562_028770 [Oryza meyeriana var. granulata]
MTSASTWSCGTARTFWKADFLKEQLCPYKGDLTDLHYRYDSLRDHYEDRGHRIGQLEALLVAARQAPPPVSTPPLAVALPPASAPPSTTTTTTAPTTLGSITAFALVWTAGFTLSTLYMFQPRTEVGSSSAPLPGARLSSAADFSMYRDTTMATYLTPRGDVVATTDTPPI